VASFFEPSGMGTYLATAHTRGPWSAEFMHAGPPTALLARACAAALANPGLRLGRIAVDILSPVPVGPVAVSARIVRPGTQVALIEAMLSAGDRPLMLARCWFLRRHEAVAVPPTSATEAPSAAGTALEAPSGWGRGYLDAIEWRWVSGGFEQRGSACVWARPLVDLVADEATTAVERLLMLADSASGISAVANPQELLFVNLDLTVHLRRDPTEGWLWMSAETRLDANGSGVASGMIGDAAGDVARTEQVLFVQPIGRTP
jgi:hypothetical protein